jgi:penicillin-binding protein 1A
MLQDRPEAAFQGDGPNPLGTAPRDMPLPGPPLPPVRRRFSRWRLLGWVLVGTILLLIATGLWLAIAAPPSQTLRPIVPPSVEFRASNGTVISRRGAITDRPVDVTALPDHVAEAFVAIEDRRFYRHLGLDPRGLGRAAWHDLRAGSMREGGSTITQQLA